MLSSKLHKMWRKFDRNVFQRLFGGRDSRMPNYFASVAELNQRILRIQDTSGHLPVSVLPQTQHLTTRDPGLLSSAASTHMSDLLTVEFQDSECVPPPAALVCFSLRHMCTPSPQPSLALRRPSATRTRPRLRPPANAGLPTQAAVPASRHCVVVSSRQRGPAVPTRCPAPLVDRGGRRAVPLSAAVGGVSCLRELCNVCTPSQRPCVALGNRLSGNGRSPPERLRPFHNA